MRTGYRNVSVDKIDGRVSVVQQAQLNCDDQSLPSHVVSGPPICLIAPHRTLRCTLCTGWSTVT